MFGWWKRNDGFEWREYVRTTILMRRQRRRDKLVEAKEAAVAGLKNAGQKGAKASATGLAALWQRCSGALATLGRSSGRLLVPLAVLPGSIVRLASQPNVRGPLLTIGGIGVGAAAYRAYSVGLDREGMVAGGIGLAAIVLCLLPRVVGDKSPPWVKSALARLPGPSPVIGGGLIAAGVAVLAGYGAARWLAPEGAGHLLSSLPSLPASLTSPLSASRPIEGRASPLTGDSLRVSNIVVRLAGVEAPEREQRCGAQGKKGKSCGEAALQAMTRLVSGKKVSCTISGSDDAGRSLAICRVEGTDIGATLVRQGHVFAQQGMFARYASAEIEARNAKSGLWKTDVERPADWRAKRWEEAKRSAPDGCPIKGAVNADGKIYVLPWARDYERIKVRSTRGERWFCSESEARSAGWRLAERS